MNGELQISKETKIIYRLIQNSPIHTFPRLVFEEKTGLSYHRNRQIRYFSLSLASSFN